MSDGSSGGFEQSLISRALTAGDLKPFGNGGKIRCELDREVAGKCAPGRKIARGHADDDRNAAIDRRSNRINQSGALSLDLAELVQHQEIGIMLQRMLDPRR